MNVRVPLKEMHSQSRDIFRCLGNKW